MSIPKLTGTTITVSMLVLAACSADIMDSPGDDIPLEQQLGLIPRLVQATNIPESGRTFSGTVSHYLILSPEAGEIDPDAIAIKDQRGDARGFPDFFEVPPSVRDGLMQRDVLLLIAVPKQHADALCHRFQFAHEEADLVKTGEQKLLYLAPAANDYVHALCLLPPSVTVSAEAKSQGNTNPAFAPGGSQNYGGGAYTLRISSLTCKDPRDWENWPYNGDEARMRGFYDGSGGGQIWGADNVKSGNSKPINRYVNFNYNATIELFDYDSAPWNASDRLGSELIYAAEACSGDHYRNFDGNGGGHDWDYDMYYRVYGPGCTCQSAEALYRYYQAETCTVTSTAVTSYTYYCSGGVYWEQAWGNRTRHCDTVENTYNESCEMQTFVSSRLASACDKYENGVAIGSPVQSGTCSSPPPPDGCIVQPGNESGAPAPSFVEPLPLPCLLEPTP